MRRRKIRFRIPQFARRRYNARMADETLVIETPEHVELHFALATIGNRFIACAIDHAIQILSIVLTLFLAYRLSSDVRRLGEKVIAGFSGGSVWIMALASLVTFVVLFGYFIFFETIWSGQTPGKRWLKLRVIQEDGRPITPFAAMARNIIRLFDLMWPPFYSVGIVSVFASEQAKRLGDFVAGTVVVKERSAEAPTFDEVFDSEIIDSAMRRVAPPMDFQGDLRAVEPADIVVLENFLRRRYDIPEQPRQWLAWRVAVPLLEKIRPGYDPATFSYEGFLEEVLARYRVQRKYND
ncbi:MAG TPA: RDD family protein [Blastocatellia bacterium]|nr:RDD family protein [Blastocatellia bacterium]HMY73542.1 RDD family protein [Blastocatellia bacterium]HMZ17225.1 RDD family protein [Blastocatellia bacterium]HNG29644.1 RDD family protein [Blastocatellia bacterium]